MLHDFEGGMAQVSWWSDVTLGRAQSRTEELSWPLATDGEGGG